jgi:hypothetical protein
MDYGRIIGRAWQITWKFKILWMFGFLAALYFGGNSTSSIRYDSMPPKLAGQFEKFFFSPAFLPVLLAIIAGFILFGLVVSILKVAGRTGLVDQVNAAEQGIRPTGRAGWSAVGRYGWRMFWINFITGLPGTLVMLLAFIPLIWATISFLLEFRKFTFYNFEPNPAPFLFGVAWFFPMCCLGVLVCTFFTLVRTLSERVCVIEDQGIWEGIKTGWRLLWSKFGSVFVMWLFIAIINIGAIGLIVVPAIILSMLFIVPLAITSQAFDGTFPVAALTGLICLGGVFWLWGMLVASITETFFSGCWTLTYRQLTGREFGGDLAECC